MRKLGPKSREWLADIGVYSLEGIAKLGVVETYKRGKAAHPEKVTLHLFDGKQAALLDIPWYELPYDIKAQLRKEAGEDQ